MLDLDFSDYGETNGETNESTITDIINTNIDEGPVKYIAYEMAKKIQEDDKPEKILINLEYLNNSLRIQTLSPFVTHRNREFDTGMLKNPKYDTYIYDIDNTQILKIINCSCGALESYMIIKELAYQQYAKDLSINCDVEIPEIIQYGRIMLDEDMRETMKYRHDCLWFILMEKMMYKTLADGIKSGKINLDNPETCNGISNKINAVRRCMEKNKLFHNDFHEENILIDTENGNRIGILDFGLADTENNNFTKNMDYTCSGLKNIKRDNNLKSPISVSIDFDNEYNFNNEYGGKPNKRKTRRKSKKMYRKSKKMYRKKYRQTKKYKR
jgi:hypothetical protein